MSTPESARLLKRRKQHAEHVRRLNARVAVVSKLDYLLASVDEMLHEAKIEQVREAKREDGGDQWVKGNIVGQVAAYNKVRDMLERELA